MEEWWLKCPPGPYMEPYNGNDWPLECHRLLSFTTYLKCGNDFIFSVSVWNCSSYFTLCFSRRSFQCSILNIEGLSLFGCYWKHEYMENKFFSLEDILNILTLTLLTWCQLVIVPWSTQGGEMDWIDGEERVVGGGGGFHKPKVLNSSLEHFTKDPSLRKSS